MVILSPISFHHSIFFPRLLFAEGNWAMGPLDFLTVGFCLLYSNMTLALL